MLEKILAFRNMQEKLEKLYIPSTLNTDLIFWHPK
jgi:hypothetical protein